MQKLQKLTINGTVYAEYTYDEHGSLLYKVIKHFPLMDKWQCERAIVSIVETITGIANTSIGLLEGVKNGVKVTYIDEDGDACTGIVKSVDLDVAYVVFKCKDDWENYHLYAPEAVEVDELLIGWPIEKVATK